jgi:hypothetical protein
MNNNKELKDLFDKLSENMLQSVQIIKSVKDKLGEEEPKTEPKKRGRKKKETVTTQPVAKIEPIKEKAVEKVVNPDFSVVNVNNKLTRRASVKASGQNAFIDEGANKDENLKYLTNTKTQRRPPAKKVNITCEKCKKTYEIPESLNKNYYVCEACTR